MIDDVGRKQDHTDHASKILITSAESLSLQNVKNELLECGVHARPDKLQIQADPAPVDYLSVQAPS